jgi:hypothetical protein
MVRREQAVKGQLVGDLGISPEAWLVLTLLSCLTLFFKFSRFWSVRNLDLLLVFAPVPGLMSLVSGFQAYAWWAYLWLFFSSGLWLVRCLIDLGMARRPVLEPNLNAAGLACLMVGLLVLLLIETLYLPLRQATARNPADPYAQPPAPPPKGTLPGAAVAELPETPSLTPPPSPAKRIVACLAHLALVAALFAVGWKHFDRASTGLAVATCYLILPYTRIALIDGGQLVPAACIVTALLAYKRPALAGVLIGIAAGCMPAVLGLIPLWAGFYWGRGTLRFLAGSVLVVGGAATCARLSPELAEWSRTLGARTLAEVGLLPWVQSPSVGSFWVHIDPSYRLPLLIAYFAFVLVSAVWPAGKDLGHLIALTAALLVACQFWYLDEGGTLVLLYLPLVLLMMFRPNLTTKRPPPAILARKIKTSPSNSGTGSGYHSTLAPSTSPQSAPAR